MNTPKRFENAEWTFFHWDDQERLSDITITTRTQNSYQYSKQHYQKTLQKI